ncbi:MAG: NAD(P)H-dependent oxidoreductase [Dysgonamonadaceae bacterium]
MNLENALHWRYATKKFDPSRKVNQQLVDKIIEAAWLAPTSSGLQPFQVFEIKNQELKEKMVPISFGQEQLADASHVLVFAAWDNYTADRIDHIFEITTSKRKMETGRYNAYAGRLKTAYLNRDASLNYEHAARQAYIALGFAMAMAAELEVDSVPLEGFDPEKLDELLGLKEMGLRSVLILPLGYRDEANDWLLKLEKVRHPMNEFLKTIE